MANPVMNSQNFQQQMQGGRQQPGWYQGAEQPAANPYGQQSPYGQASAFGAGQAAQAYGHHQTMEDAFRAPAAGAEHTGRMTYNDVAAKGGLMLVLVVVGAVVGWGAPGLMGVGAIVGMVLGLVNAFKRKPSPVLIMLYGIAQGLFLGGLSSMFEYSYPGIVLQAVLGTFSVFAVMLALYTSGRFRPTPRLTKIFMGAMLGFLIFSLINLVLAMVGVTGGMFGMRTGLMGLIVGAVAIVLGAYSLSMDFAAADEGVRNGAPQSASWTVAFGLTVTMIWLYVEILRVLSILRGSDD